MNPVGRTKDKGPRTKNKEQRTKNKGQRTKNKGQKTKDKEQRTKNKNQKEQTKKRTQDLLHGKSCPVNALSPVWQFRGLFITLSGFKNHFWLTDRI